MTTLLSAILLAAGQGTRMRSATPKVLHRTLGRSLIGHAVENVRGAGATYVCIVVGHGRDAVEADLRVHHGGPDLRFVVQEEQKGTGHAVLMARPLLAGLAGHTLVLPGDVPNLAPATLAAFVEHGTRARRPVAVLTAVVDDPTGYGRIVRDPDGRLLRNVEHRDADEAQRAITEINSGVYLFDNAFLWENLDRIGVNNAQGEHYLPDLIELAAEHGGATAYVAGEPHEIAGVNTRVQLAAAEAFGRARRNEALMLDGVTMIDPASTWVDASVSIAPDVTLEPNVRLTGATHIATGCILGQGCVVQDTVLEEHVVLLPYCHLEGAVVRTRAQLGPFAHLRPLADIGADARIGNFVEVKKSTLGAGTKANHLSYIGDAIIGARCNIGAGTITCNYDGTSKHTTVLGDNVFTGSNSALVAPITVGDGAYVGAGSTVTQNIPADALAVARGRQRNIEGWVTRWKQLKK